MNMLEGPPGILDLIPWQPSPGDHHIEAFDLQPRLWSQLPEHLLHSILARLPFQSVLRFRSVCRQWQALFGSPAFHHIPSHASHTPPWIFFLGSTRRFPQPYNSEESEAEINYDDGRDDDGFLFEGSEHGDGDRDSNDGFVLEGSEHGGSDSSDSNDSRFMDSNDDPGDAQDAMRHGEHGDIYSAMLCDDHGSMHDVVMCGDHVDTHGVDARDDDHMNDSEALEELLLIFDCASKSWRPTLAMPAGFKRQPSQNFFARHDVCSFHEYILIPTCSDMSRFFLFNPAAPLCKELPPCIAAQVLEGLGFSVEMATLSRSGTSLNLSNFLSLSNQNHSVEQFVQDTTGKVLQVVVVGETTTGTYVVENFNSTTGSWRISGYLPKDDTYFIQKQMVVHKGSFYAITTNGILKLDNVLGGQNMECTFRQTPIAPGDDDGRGLFLIESRLVATTDAIFMIGITVTYAPHSQDIEDWDILIWQFLPHVPEDVCWQFVAYAPEAILENYFGNIHVSTIGCRGHGDLIFFHIPNRHRFLIYDVDKNLWRFSAKCKWFLGSMAFVWEPLLRN